MLDTVNGPQHACAVIRQAPSSVQIPMQVAKVPVAVYAEIAWRNRLTAAEVKGMQVVILRPFQGHRSNVAPIYLPLQLVNQFGIFQPIIFAIDSIEIEQVVNVVNLRAQIKATGQIVIIGKLQ